MVGTDALLTILEDVECQKLLRDALMEYLKADPLVFYKEIIQPRAAKLISAPSSLQEYVKLTPGQEAKMMDSLTTGYVQTKDTKIMLAEDFLWELFDKTDDKEIPSSVIFDKAAEQDINKNSIYAAAQKLGVTRRREGRREGAKAFWSLNESMPDKAIDRKKAVG